MKKCIITLAVLVLIGCTPLQSHALSAQMGRVYQLAASGWVALTEAQADGLNINFRGQTSIRVFRDWLKIQSGHSGSLGMVFPDDVYDVFLSGFDGFSYGDVSVNAHWAPPVCVVTGDTITCDDAPETETLYLWNYVEFTPSGVIGVISGSQVSFSGLAPGVYVVSRQEQSFPTPFITVP